jgi:hypothetical protein
MKVIAERRAVDLGEGVHVAGCQVIAMMPTAVQELSSRECGARVVFGTPFRRERGTRGPILLFAPGCVVAYRIRHRHYSTGCVFRTATSAAVSGDRLPGVSPAPHILFGFVRGRHFERAVLLVRELGRRGIADTLPSESYLRAAPALARPDFNVRLLAETLEASWIY